MPIRESAIKQGSKERYSAPRYIAKAATGLLILNNESPRCSISIASFVSGDWPFAWLSEMCVQTNAVKSKNMAREGFILQVQLSIGSWQNRRVSFELFTRLGAKEHNAESIVPKHVKHR